MPQGLLSSPVPAACQLAADAHLGSPHTRVRTLWGLAAITSPRGAPEAPNPHPTLPTSPARDGWGRSFKVTVLCSPGADPSESGTFTLGCSVPSSHQHAAVPSQHPCCNIAWEKSNPTVSLLPLGILPLGGQRGCLPSLPGHSTLSEPKTRKVLMSPATDRRREVSILPKKLHSTPS